MDSAAIKLAFDAALTSFAEAEQLAVDWRDRKDRRVFRAKWLRPHLAPDVTIPGPRNRGILMGTLRGNYVVECFSPLTDGEEAAFALADEVAVHFFPRAHEPQTLATPAAITIRLETIPSVVRAGPLSGDWHRATTLIPYFVFATSTA